MKFNQLESDILKWMIDDTGDDNLRQQLSRSKLIKRNYTGAGFFLTLAVPDDVPKILDHENDINPVPGPYIESSVLEAGGDTVLYINDGIVKTLEIFSYGNMFPESLENYELIKPDRNIGA